MVLLLVVMCLVLLLMPRCGERAAARKHAQVAAAPPVSAICYLAASLLLSSRLPNPVDEAFQLLVAEGRPFSADMRERGLDETSPLPAWVSSPPCAPSAPVRSAMQLAPSTEPRIVGLMGEP